MLLNVLVVDDHPAVRMGWAIALEKSGAYTLCGEAWDVPGACAETARLKPDAIILDLYVGGRDGLEFIREMRAAHPAGRILVYSAHDERFHAQAALDAGAQGYFMKTVSPKEVVTRLADLMAGHIVLSRAMEQLVLRQSLLREPRTPAAHGMLSQREFQIFRLLGMGLDSAAISSELHLSIKTVGTYRERLKVKLQLAGAEALLRAAERFVRDGVLPESPVPAR